MSDPVDARTIPANYVFTKINMGSVDMRKFLLLVGTVFLLVPFLLVGCGVAQEQYDAVISDLGEAQQEIHTVKAELQTLQDRLSELKSSLQETQMNLEITQARLETTQKGQVGNSLELFSIANPLVSVEQLAVLISILVRNIQSGLLPAH